MCGNGKKTVDVGIFYIHGSGDTLDGYSLFCRYAGSIRAFLYGADDSPQYDTSGRSGLLLCSIHEEHYKGD